MPFEKDLRSAVQSKAETLGYPGGFHFHDCPDVGGVIGTESEVPERAGQALASERLSFAVELHPSLHQTIAP
jgi:hypothetical protein